jgi:hypothetical protein
MALDTHHKTNKDNEMSNLASVSNNDGVGVTLTPCWQCHELIGVMPAVYKDGIVYKICCDCWIDWQPFMHAGGCNCEHHAWCDSVLAESGSIPYGL